MEKKKEKGCTKNLRKQIEKELKEKLDDEYEYKLYTETIEYLNDVLDLKAKIGKLNTQLGELSLSKLKTELSLKSRISELTNLVHTLNYKLNNYETDKQDNKKDIERVVLKYHLNIV